MKLPKEFEYYVQKRVIKKQSPDVSRARFLIEESKKSLQGLKDRVKVMKINEFNSNSIIKDSYDIIMELIRARLLLDGYSSSGSFAHEAELSYIKKFNFSNNELSFLNELRYFRNSITYYGKILDEDYARKVYDFLNKIIGRLNKIVKN